MLKVDGLNRIPDNVGYDEASAAEPFACAINAQELLGIEEGDTVVVFGAGPIGCMHIRIARGVHKAGPVFLVDVNADRLKMSADAVQPDETINGAEVDVVERVMELTGGRGADVIITATAANVTQEQAIAMAARNGRISFFGGLPKTDPTITCDSNVVHYRQLHIHGANGSAPEHNKRALEYISTGQVPVKDLITEHIPLERVARRVPRSSRTARRSRSPSSPDRRVRNRARTGRLRRLGSGRADARGGRASAGRGRRPPTDHRWTETARPSSTTAHARRPASREGCGPSAARRTREPRGKVTVRLRPERGGPCAQHGRPRLSTCDKNAGGPVSSR